MQSVAFRYILGINSRPRCSGRPFQSRYQAIVGDADSYLIESVRYVHFNPLRAALAAGPLDYP